MKNLFAFGALALALTVASCGNNAAKTEENAAVDTTVVAEETVTVTDSTVTDSVVVDTTVSAQ